MPTAADDWPLPLRLEDWVDDQFSDLAKQEGSFSAITCYAIREGWFNPVFLSAYRQPRPIRTMGHDQHCEEVRNPQPPAPIYIVQRMAEERGFLHGTIMLDRQACAAHHVLTWDGLATLNVLEINISSNLPSAPAGPHR